MSGKSRQHGGPSSLPRGRKYTQGFRKQRRREKAQRALECSHPVSSSRGAAQALVLISAAFLLSFLVLGIAHAIFSWL